MTMKKTSGPFTGRRRSATMDRLRRSRAAVVSPSVFSSTFSAGLVCGAFDAASPQLFSLVPSRKYFVKGRVSGEDNPWFPRPKKTIKVLCPANLMPSFFRG